MWKCILVVCVQGLSRFWMHIGRLSDLTLTRHRHLRHFFLRWLLIPISWHKIAGVCFFLTCSWSESPIPQPFSVLSPSLTDLWATSTSRPLSILLLKAEECVSAWVHQHERKIYSQINKVIYTKTQTASPFSKCNYFYLLLWNRKCLTEAEWQYICYRLVECVGM